MGKFQRVIRGNALRLVFQTQPLSSDRGRLRPQRFAEHWQPIVRKVLDCGSDGRDRTP